MWIKRENKENENNIFLSNIQQFKQSPVSR